MRMGFLVISYFFATFWLFCVFLDVAQKVNKRSHYQTVSGFHSPDLLGIFSSKTYMGEILIHLLIAKILVFFLQGPTYGESGAKCT